MTRFLKMAALGAKKAGHQTALVRKAAILNRVRLNVRQAAVNRGHERMYKMASTEAMSHGVQLVTASTGAMHPGRGIMQGSVPPGWRPHTTGTEGVLNAANGENASKRAAQTYLTQVRPTTVTRVGDNPPSPAPNVRSPPPSRFHPAKSPAISPVTSPLLKPATAIMTPYTEDDEDGESSFPTVELDGRYDDLSDDDMEGVYTNFEVLFQNKSESGSPESSQQEGDHYYEEYLDELDGLPWVS